MKLPANSVSTLVKNTPTRAVKLEIPLPDGIETGLRTIEPEALADSAVQPLAQAAHGAACRKCILVAAELRRRDRSPVAKAVPVLTLGFAALLRRQVGAPDSRQQNRHPDIVAADLHADVDINPAGIRGDADRFYRRVLLSRNARQRSTAGRRPSSG